MSRLVGIKIAQVGEGLGVGVNPIKASWVKQKGGYVNGNNRLGW